VITDVQKSERLRNWSFNSTSVEVVGTGYYACHYKLEMMKVHLARVLVLPLTSRDPAILSNGGLIASWCPGYGQDLHRHEKGDSLHHQRKEGSLITFCFPGH
jgi:hypothetical protein